MLQFFVATAIGLAPLLGKVGVPGFSALLEMFPVQVQNGLLPLASVLMGTVVVTTDFLLSDKPLARARAKRIFARLLLVSGGAIIGLLVMYTQAVAQVPYDGGLKTATFMVGFPPREYSGKICPKACVDLSASDCIKEIGFYSEKVTSCFGEEKVNLSSLIYSLFYLVLMGALASLVSVGILGSRQRRAARL